MTRLDWDAAPRIYEAGVDRGVLYSDGVGVPWNGIIEVNEQASATQDLDLYLDGQRLAIMQDVGDFEATIQAYTYPPEFDEHNGYSPSRAYKRFGLSYRTQKSDGDKLHIVYNALVQEPDRGWSTISDVADPSTFQWQIVASAIDIPGARPSAHLVIDMADTDTDVLAAIEGWLYGTELDDARLPEPDELVDIFEAATILKITYHGDGSYTADGPDEYVTDHGDGSFTISAPTAFLISEGVFTVKSF